MYRLIVGFLLLGYFVFPVVLKAELPFDELALYMSFSQLDGDKVIDESGNKNHGKIEKAKLAKGKGKYGDAMQFKGGDNHVLIKSSKTLSIPDEVTISVWVNWNDAPGDGWLAVLANGKQGGPWENYGLFVNRGSRYFYFTTSLGGEGEHKVRNSGNNTTEPEKWTHCVCTYDGKTAKIYVDGELKKEDAQGLKLVGGNVDLRLGHREGSGHWYNGLIDEVAIFSVALNKKQVQEASGELAVLMAVQPEGKLATVWGRVKFGNR